MTEGGNEMCMYTLNLVERNLSTVHLLSLFLCNIVNHQEGIEKSHEKGGIVL
jgi:hypothetical protein